MRRAWAGLVDLIERVTLVRALLVLLLLNALSLCLLAASVLTEGEPPLPAEPPPTLDVPPIVATAVPLPVSAPIVATAVPLPVSAPNATDEPTPTATPLPVAIDDLNILLLGTDRRPGKDPTWRTDTIIVVAVRPRARQVAMLSIPRDLWVYIPGWQYNRINVVDYLGERTYGRGGGPRLVAATLQENLRVPIHAYVRVHILGLERIIDALGGVMIDPGRSFDETMDVSAAGPYRLHLSPGLQHMDGRTAIGYARSRRHSDDLDRSRRQQQVLLAIRDAALQPAVVPHLPELLVALADTVDTNLSPAQALALVGLATQLDLASYRTRVLDRTMVRDWITPGGAMVLLPNRARIERVWAELTAP